MDLAKPIRILALACGAALSAAPAAAQDLAELAGIVEAWLASPHGNYHSRSFTYWNADGEVPASCAACHSGPGFIDFLGADGTPAGVVDGPAPIQSPVDCAACHTSAAHALDAVTFPSGIEMDGLGASAPCMVCHQGRQSSDRVAAAVAGMGEDTVSAELGFLNIHYRAAAATLMGSAAKGGYEYPGKRYDGRFAHVRSANTCVACHDPHTTEVAEDACLSCHQGAGRLTDIRAMHADFDGDGDRAEGIHGEILTLLERLGEAMVAYAAQVAGTPIVYADSHPYFFIDTDGDGTAGESEAVSANRYRSWTPRLLKAAYNYQFVAKDPGGYAHNPAYMLQLLYDSLESLAQQASVDISRYSRP